MTLHAYLDAACTQEVGGTPDVGTAQSGFTFQTGIGTDSVLYFREDAGKRTPGAVTVHPVTAHGTADYPADVTVSATAGSYAAAATGASIGIVTGSEAVPCHFMQTTGRADEAHRPFFVRAVYGGASILLPAISGVTISPSASAITTTWTPNATATSVKQIVQLTSATAPDDTAWAAATVRASGYAATGLSAVTGYTVYLRAYDADGLSSDAYSYATTTLSASNNAPTIGTVSIGTVLSDRFTVTASVTDPEGDTITAKKYIIKTASTAPVQADWDTAQAFTSPQVITGLTQATAYSVWLYATDATHPNLASGASVSAQLAQTTATLGNVSGFTATAGNAQNSMAWTNASALTTVIDRATDAGFTTVTAGIYSGTAATFTDTGRTNGTAYYYRAKFTDAQGNLSASYATANATPAFSADYSYDFSGGTTLASTTLVPLVSGTGTATTTRNANVLTCYGSGAGNGAAFLDPNRFTFTGNTRHTFKFNPAAWVSNASFAQALMVLQNATAPTTIEQSTVFNGKRRISCGMSNGDATKLVCYYWNSANVQYSWSGTAWTTAVPSGITISSSAYYRAVIESEYNAGSPRWRIVMQDANGTPLTNGTTAWVAWSGTYSSGANPYYIQSGSVYSDSAATGLDTRYTIVKRETY